MSETKKSDVLLSVKNLTKRYRYGRETIEAVRGISLEVHPGEFVAVMGASGSGKSTLLHALAGLVSVEEGEIEIAGEKIASLSDKAMTFFRRRHIGLIFQAYNLLPALSGEENIALPKLLDGKKDEGHLVRELIEKLGLREVAGRHPDSMSGGEQQRVAIGRALAMNPSIILADEPTGNLDSSNSRMVCELFRKLCTEEKKTVLMVTHNPMVAYWAERIVILKDGRIIRDLKRNAFETVQKFAQAYLDIIDTGTEEGHA